MARSGEQFVLNKIIELAQRCGVDPLIADVYLEQVFRKGPDGQEGMDGHYVLASLAGHEEEDVMPKIDKFHELLGLDDDGNCTFLNLHEVNERVDRALALVPRARGR